MSGYFPTTIMNISDAPARAKATGTFRINNIKRLMMIRSIKRSLVLPYE
jgi:hypothetical protein